MPRDANGNYTLPSGNPVITGTTIESAWANTTMDDIKQGLTDSLDRFGRGGMQAPFRFIDGTQAAPGMSWASELSTGFYRAGASDMRATVAGVPQMRWTGVGVDVWDSVAGEWRALTNAAGANFALLNAANRFTGASQTIINTAGSWSLWKDATPTLGARLAFNTLTNDALEVSHYSGGAWAQKLIASATQTIVAGTTIEFYDQTVNVPRVAITASQLQLINGHVLSLRGPTAMGGQMTMQQTDAETFDMQNVTVGSRYIFYCGSTPYFELSGNPAAPALILRAASSLNFNNVDNSGNSVISRNALGSLSLAIGGTQHGGIVHWFDANLPSGRITISTTTPAATGSAGAMVLVYE